MDDSAIIELFFARSEQAIRELDGKYGKTCHRLSYNILHNSQDAEECVNDAYLGAWNAIPPARPNPLLAFLCRIVRNLSLMRYHADRAAKRGGGSYTVALEELEGCLASPRTVEGNMEDQELIRRTFWILYPRRIAFCLCGGTGFLTAMGRSRRGQAYRKRMYPSG